MSIVSPTTKNKMESAEDVPMAILIALTRTTSLAFGLQALLLVPKASDVVLNYGRAIAMRRNDIALFIVGQIGQGSIGPLKHDWPEPSFGGAATAKPLP